MEIKAKNNGGLSTITYDWVSTVKGVDAEEKAVPVNKEAFVATMKRKDRIYVIGSGYN